MTIVLACGAAAAFAGEAAAPDTWHVGPVPDVRAICHASDSLWVGTSAGVFVLDIRDPSRRAHIGAGARLASNSVRAIAANGDSVWVATDAGLTLFYHGKVRVYSARASKSAGTAPLRFIQHVAFAKNGDVLLATRRGGVGVVRQRGGFAITRRDSLIDDDVFGILERDGRPRLYACGAGLCAQIDDTTMVSFQAGAGLPRGEVRQVVGDLSTAYVRIARRGIFRFDGKHATSVDAPKGIWFGDATSMALGADHALWVTGPGWVLVRRNNKWKRVETPAEVDASWRVVVADGAGAFAGSAAGAIVALNRGTAFRASLGDGLPGAAVESISPDGRGASWFVSGGRVVGANAPARTLSVENGPVDAAAVEFSPSGKLIVAGRWTVSRRDENGWADLAPDTGEKDPAFTSVFVDGGDMVWVGTRSGALYRFDGETWIRYARPRAGDCALRNARAFPKGDWALLGPTPVQGVAGSWRCFAGWDSTACAVDVAMNPAGEWFAATKDRVFRYDSKRDVWQSMGPNGPVTGPRAAWDTPAPITSIAFDASGRLFIGTTDGIGSLAGAKLRWWNATDGIGGERVTDLAVDANTLWVGFGEDGFSAIPFNRLR